MTQSQLRLLYLSMVIVSLAIVILTAMYFSLGSPVHASASQYVATQDVMAHSDATILNTPDDTQAMIEEQSGRFCLDNNVIVIGDAVCCGACNPDVRTSFPSTVMCSAGLNTWVPCDSFTGNYLNRLAIQCADDEGLVHTATDTVHPSARWGDYLIFSLQETLEEGNHLFSLPCHDMLTISIDSPFAHITSSSSPRRDSRTSSSTQSPPPPQSIQPPLADFTMSTTQGEAPLNITFDASTSTAGTGELTTYAWDFGDGEYEILGQIENYTYLDDGTFNVRLTVTQTDGQQNTRVRTVEVHAPQNYSNGGDNGNSSDNGNGSNGDNNSTSTINVVIEPSRTTCVAPCGIHFDASMSSSQEVAEPHHELVYLWDFDDPSSVFQHRQGMSADNAQGPIVAHVFDNPGTYQVTVTVRDSSEQSTVEQTIVVEDPQHVFSDNTYCISSSGNFAGCPMTDSAYHLDRNLNEAINMICSSSSPMRVLLQRTDTFISEDEFNVQCDGGPHILASFGSGSGSATIKNNGGHSAIRLRHTDAFTITDIDFKGTYDASTGLGSRPTAIYLDGTTEHLLIYRNTFDGFGVSVLLQEHHQEIPKHNIVADNKITNWHDYGIYGTFYHSAIIGNSVRQHPNAITGNEGKCGHCSPNFADHGPMRINSAEHTSIAYNDLFSKNGWSSLGWAIQSALRLSGGESSTLTMVTDNVLRGGLSVLAISQSSEQEQSTATGVIVERNIFTAGEDTDEFIISQFGGQVIRNNIFVSEPSNMRWPNLGASGLHTFLRFRNTYNPNANAPSGTNHIYHNNFINLDPHMSPSGIQIAQGSSNNPAPFSFRVHNNLMSSEHGRQFIEYDNPAVHNIVSDNNLYHTQTGTWMSGQDSNSVSDNPMLKKFPYYCEALQKHIVDVDGLTASSDGLRSYLSKSGVDFSAGNMRVAPSDRLKITHSSHGSQSLDCNLDGDGDSSYASCTDMGVPIFSGGQGKITLANDFILTQGVVVDVTIRTYPSTPNKLYVSDTFEVGDVLTYNLQSESHTVSSTGIDDIGHYIMVQPALTEKPDGFVCTWQGNNPYTLDWLPQHTSPAVDAGKTIHVLTDFASVLRPQGAGHDIGAFER